MWARVRELTPRLALSLLLLVLAVLFAIAASTSAPPHAPIDVTDLLDLNTASEEMRHGLESSLGNCTDKGG